MTKNKHWLIFILLLMLLFGILTAAVHQAFLTNTPGIDYYSFWTAGRAFFSGQDPYSPEIHQQIQIGIYGHPARPDENKMEFANPVYALFILLPFLWLDFNWSQAAWMSFNLLLMITAAYILFPQAPRWVKLTFPFFFPLVFGYILGNYAVTITAFLIIFLKFLIQPHLLTAKWQVILGALIAWCTIKPQFIWAYLLLFLLFGFRQRTWTMLRSFFITLLGMIGLGMAFQMNWIQRWVIELISYGTYNSYPNVLNQYLGLVFPAALVQLLYYLILSLCAGLTIIFFYRYYHRRLDPLTITAWCGFIAYLVHPGGGGGVSYAQAIFIIPFFLWAALQKPSFSIAVIWVTGLVFSYLCNASALLRMPAWLEQLYFLLYGIWLGWMVIKPTLQIRPGFKVVKPL